MVSVAYLVFTFLACVLGAGLGLIIFRAWRGGLAPDVAAAPKLKDGSEEDKWEAIQKWQVHENRTFAACVGTCAASPLALAVVAWTLRGEVVGTICSGLTSVAMSSPLCF